MNERAYDVYLVTLKKVVTKAANVSRDEALLTMSNVLADYGDNWQLQPEHPTGCVKVVNRHTSEYHIVLVIETDLSHRRHEAERIVERQQLRWLAQVNQVETFSVGKEYSNDYTVDVDKTPLEAIDSLREGAYPSAANESEVVYAYQI